MKPFIFTETSLNILATRELTPDWFVAPKQLLGIGSVAVIENDEGFYVLTADDDVSSRLLVIRRSEDGLFEKVSEFGA